MPLFRTIGGFLVFAGLLVLALVVAWNWLQYQKYSDNFSPERTQESNLGFLVGILLLFVASGIAFFVGRSGYRALQKAKEYFYLWVGTAGGETPNLGGTDRQFFRRLVDAINQAIVDRGGH